MTQWSPLQNEIFRQTSVSSDNLLVQAVAGSGKTTTIAQACQYTTASRPIYAAFNKAIAEQFAAKIPSHARSSTLNGLGHRIVQKAYRRATHDRWKLWNLARKQTQIPDWVSAIVSAVSFAQNCAIGIPGYDEPSIEYFTQVLQNSTKLLHPSDIPQLANKAFKVFQASLHCDSIFDFNDQVYQPIFLGENPYQGHDLIFVDETQDLAPINQAGLFLAHKAGSRIIAVGDRAQAIYAWRGADDNSMDTLQSAFDMKELPLSITYRCPQSVVALAKQYCSAIEARQDAPEGQVRNIINLPSPEAYPQDSLILCRNNAPLFATALQFVRASVPCQLLTTIGQELLQLINRLDGDTNREALLSLDKWRDEMLALMEIGDPQATNVHERYNCIKPFFDNLTGYKSDTLAQIRHLLDNTSGVRISTIHKAKGLEASNVYFEQPELLGNEGQELNLFYVAVTRSSENLSLHYLESQDKYEDSDYPSEDNIIPLEPEGLPDGR